MGVNCPPCARQMFELDEIYNNFGRDVVEIVSIDVWVINGESAQNVYELIEAFRCSSPCDYENQYSHLYIRDLKEYLGKTDGLDIGWIFGLDDISGTLIYKYQINAVPTLMILDKNGNIYYSQSGYTGYSVLAEKINEIIGG